MQAIATARRLGAIVSATDVRAAAKEQVESLGATFITVDEEAARSAETAGGYAREMGEDYQRRQREKITEALKRTDIVICTALIPGRKAPVLLTADDGRRAWRRARSSSTSRSRPAAMSRAASPGEIVTTANGVRIIGHLNMPSRIAVDASQLYARNLLAFLALLFDKEKKLRIDTADEIVKATLLTLDGAVVNPALRAGRPRARRAPPADGEADGGPRLARPTRRRARRQRPARSPTSSTTLAQQLTLASRSRRRMPARRSSSS